MKAILACIILLALIACSQPEAVAPAVVVAPQTVAIFAQCEASRALGESCEKQCDCRKPLDCVEGACLRTKLDDGELCRLGKQCNSSYCTQEGKCGGPNGPKANYDCRKICSDNYDFDGSHCHTVCSYSLDLTNDSARTWDEVPYS